MPGAARWCRGAEDDRGYAAERDDQQGRPQHDPSGHSSRQRPHHSRCRRPLDQRRAARAGLHRPEGNDPALFPSPLPLTGILGLAPNFAAHPPEDSNATEDPVLRASNGASRRGRPIQIGGSARVIHARIDHSARPGERARVACTGCPEMSYTTLTVPLMHEPPRRHDITIRVAKEQAAIPTRPRSPRRQPGSGGQGREHPQRAHRRGDHLRRQRPRGHRAAAVAVALAVVADALRAGHPLPSPSR